MNDKTIAIKYKRIKLHFVYKIAMNLHIRALVNMMVAYEYFVTESPNESHVSQHNISDTDSDNNLYTGIIYC